MSWCTALSACLALAALPAQPARQERRTVALHAGYLFDLWRSARELPAERVAAIDDALATRVTGNPFGTVLEALARRDGVEFDATYVARRMVHAVALPEVVDPTVFEDEAKETPYRLHVTLVTPFVLATSEPLAFAAELCAPTGDVVARHRVEATTAAALSRFEVKFALPVSDLPDGPYTLVVRADVGERTWVEGDPEARADVRVQRGFAAATRALEQRVDDLLAAAPPRVDGALRGALWPLQRVYGGHAFEGYADFGGDQRNAVRVVDNVAAERHPFAGLEGFGSLAVAVGSEDTPQYARLRVRPAARDTGASDPGVGNAAAGLVLFLPGDPTWDGLWLRPSLARSMPPGFLASALTASGFDARHRFHLAVMESPGDLRQPREALRAVLDALTATLASDPTRVVLVGEREGAAAILAAWQAGALAAPPRGIVLAVHAGVGRPDAERVQATPLLLVPGRGHGSTENLVRATTQLGEAGQADQVRLLEASHAWPWALPWALPEIEAFCAARLR